MVGQISHQILRLLAAAALLLPLSGLNAANENGPPDCVKPDGWRGIAAASPQFVVFGETHGTTQAPALVQSLICALAKDGKRVLFAAEFRAMHNLAWQAAWDGPPSHFRATVAQGGWIGREDGVASEAMLALVTHLHRLKSDGAAIDVVAFNGARDDEQRARFADLPGQGPHEAAQAENIANAARDGEYDFVIVLVGSLHAQTAAVTMAGITFEPMAMRLREYGPVISLRMWHAGGSSWSCYPRADFVFVPGRPVPADAIQCGASEQSGTGEFGGNMDEKPFLSLASRENYDGYFWVGPITASRPAFPSPLPEAASQ